MYYVIVATCMLVGPLLCLGVDPARAGGPVTAALVAKWFAFWAVGCRLGLAGARQVVQPTYTARVILGLQGDEALVLVRELGFANLGVGLVGLLSLRVPAWRPAAALAGGVFYALAGLNHLRQTPRTRAETIALGSDLFAAVVLLGVVLTSRTGCSR